MILHGELQRQRDAAASALHEQLVEGTASPETLVALEALDAYTGTPYTICPTTNKRSYSSAYLAKRATRSAGHPMRAYTCNDCGAWHITKR